MHTRHRRDMDGQICSKISGVSFIVAAMYIRDTRSISELKGVSYTRLFMAPKRKKSTGDESGDLTGHHTQATCLEMFDPNVHMHTFHNEMTLCPDETTCDAEQVR